MTDGTFILGLVVFDFTELFEFHGCEVDTPVFDVQLLRFLIITLSDVQVNSIIR